MAKARVEHLSVRVIYNRRAYVVSGNMDLVHRGRVLMSVKHETAKDYAYTISWIPIKDAYNLSTLEELVARKERYLLDPENRRRHPDRDLTSR